MPKQTNKRPTNQPIIPQVSIETWKGLIAAANAFRDLAPWDWMHDSQVIGLRHPVTDEVLLGCILGRMRSVFALLVYRNRSGHRWLLNTILNDGDAGGFEREFTAFEQDLVKAEFVPKRELSKEDKSVLAACRHSPREGSGPAWPQFRSLVPGAVPWHLRQDEAETLLFALPRVAAAARVTRDQPGIWQDHLEGEIAFLPASFDPAVDELSPSQLEWRPMIPPPEQPPESVSLDETTLGHFSKLSPRKGFHLELDVTYAPFSVADEERPFFPKLAMAVDRASGLIGGWHIADAKDRDGARALRTALQNALKAVAHKPLDLRVQRPRVAAMLSNVAKELRIPVKLDSELQSLNLAREAMEQMFRRAS